MQEDTVLELMETAERLQAVTVALEAAAAKLAEQPQSVGPIVAVDAGREAELERKLAEAEARIAELTAAAVPAGRKTVPSGAASMLAKQGVSVESVEASAIDAALASLSIEQRIAVKAELLRAGLLG